MRTRRVDSQRERHILIAMVTSTEFLAQAARVIELDLIEAEHVRQVMQWCLEHYEKHREAPNKTIDMLLASWSEGNDNETLVDSVNALVDSLGKEYVDPKKKPTELNVAVLMDELGDLIADRRLARLANEINGLRAQKKPREAEALVNAYRSVAAGKGAKCNPLTDKSVWKRAFSHAAKPVISFSGDAGSFFNPVMLRGGLIGVQASEKTGKTWWLLEFAMRALRQRRKVAFFEVGDLSEEEVNQRFGMRWASRPLYQFQCKKPILLPQDIEFTDGDSDDDGEEGSVGYSIKCMKKHINHRVTQHAVEQSLRRIRRAWGHAEGKEYLQTSTHSTGTMNVRGITAILDQWEQEDNFIADVIIIDYADILAPEETKREGRDRTNDTWMALRRLSQDKHALTITATQAKATQYTNTIRPQTKADFGEDHRKMAHVTGWLGLSQTPLEKDVEGQRLNWIAVRGSPSSENRMLYVGNCFALGRALACAKLRDYRPRS